MDRVAGTAGSEAESAEFPGVSIPIERDPALEPATLWEKAAATRWGAYVSEIEEKAIWKAQELAGPPGLAVDIGCEGGRRSMPLSRLGWKMVCLDVTHWMLRFCRSRIPSARCILVDRGARSIPCATGAASLMLCMEVAPVINSDWFPAEAARVLRAGGVLVGVLFNRHSFRGAAARLRRLWTGGFSYYRQPWSKLAANLEDHGFRLVHEEGFCWMPFGRQSNSASVDSLVELERVLGLRKLVSWSPWVAFVAQRQADH